MPRRNVLGPGWARPPVWAQPPHIVEILPYGIGHSPNQGQSPNGKRTSTARHSRRLTSAAKPLHKSLTFAHHSPVILSFVLSLTSFSIQPRKHRLKIGRSFAETIVSPAFLIPTCLPN